MSKRTARPLLIVGTLLLALSFPVVAERADDSARASKNGTLQASIDGVQIQIEYGRPKVKGRTVWGALVPNGKPWRTGADEATTIKLDADAKINGESLSAGTYSLFTIPGESEWTFVFNSVAQQWGAFSYDAGQDVLRVTSSPKAVDHTEELEFLAVEGSIVLRWEKLAVGFEVEAD